MTMNLNSSRRIASLLVLSLVLAGCASGPNAPSPDLLQRIDSARTRGDHEALATYYDREAAAARAKAAEHRKMAMSYQGRVPDPRAGGSLPAHCNAIVRMQEGIAAEYEGMASAHRQFAEQARP
jgi:hypothetical protein